MTKTSYLLYYLSTPFRFVINLLCIAVALAYVGIVPFVAYLLFRTEHFVFVVAAVIVLVVVEYCMIMYALEHLNQSQALRLQDPLNHVW